jgi:hypothetical protein
MPIWIGETWVCEREYCDTVNAIIRRRCRSCGTAYPGPAHPDPEINRGVQADMREAATLNSSLGLSRWGQPYADAPKGENS